MLNEGLREWGHQFVYDACELGRLLEEAGFREVTQVAWRESTTPALRNLECRPFHGEIICEATKFSS
jgi:predicted SAM-dependent methyltransferase